MAETTEHQEPTLDRKAIALVLIILLIVGALLASLIFDPHTDRSDSRVLVGIGAFYALLYADRKLASWLNDGRVWKLTREYWPWSIIGLDGLRVLNIGVGILLILAGIGIYVKPLL